jgi:hypothetical protein
MNRELMRRVDRLEDDSSFGLRRRLIVLWRATGEDQASIMARAVASGYRAGDRLYVLSWQGTRQPRRMADSGDGDGRQMPSGGLLRRHLNRVLRCRLSRAVTT